jgi:A/G-specific adenine glycosylase
VRERRAAASPPGRRRARSAVPFEATDRWARGRVLAALLAGEPPPELDPEREARVLAGLERDGLIARDGGLARLP